MPDYETCSKWHNSLLHNDNYKEKSEVKSKSKEESKNDKDLNDVTCNHSGTGIVRSSQVLLSTAMVKIRIKMDIL